MKYRVCELNGALLDQAVAKSLGLMYDKAIDVHVEYPLHWEGSPRYFSRCSAVIDGQIRQFSPSSSWGDGGPIIEQERITIGPAPKINHPHPFAAHATGDNQWPSFGDSPLIAAMRALVISRCGEDVVL